MTKKYLYKSERARIKGEQSASERKILEKEMRGMRERRGEGVK